MTTNISQKQPTNNDKFCHLEFTDDRFVYAKKIYYGIPLLVDSKCSFVTPACDYFRHLVINDHLRTTSVKTYAESILNFWRYLEDRRMNFLDISDYDLIIWLNQQETNKVSASTMAARCDAVFDFYVWMERNAYVNHMVKIPGWNDIEQFTPQITAVVVKGASKIRRGSKFGVMSAVRPRAPKGTFQPTPTADDVSRIYFAADNPNSLDLTDRNHLLIDWYTQVGVRRAEWRSLTKDQIPEWKVIYSLQRLGEAHELRLTKTKGGRVRYVGVLPELLVKTREYIEGRRVELVLRFKRLKGINYKEPDEVFLSEKTGMPLALTAITNLMTGWFKKSGVAGHGHRLRATYLTSLFEAEIAAEELRIAANPNTKIQIDYELILLKVAERAGHANIDSLRPYLTLARKRRSRGESAAFVTLQQRVDALKQQLIVLENRVKHRKVDLLLQR